MLNLVQMIDDLERMTSLVLSLDSFDSGYYFVRHTIWLL